MVTFLLNLLVCAENAVKLSKLLIELAKCLNYTLNMLIQDVPKKCCKSLKNTPLYLKNLKTS